MGKARGITALLATVALCAGMLSTGPVASASHAAITIQVGARLDGAPGRSMRFLGPSTITVHQGDQITFDFRGFHTATFLPVGVGADDWIADNAERTGPFSFVASDPDEGVNEYKDNFDSIVTPSNPDCGGEAEAPCSYNGDTVLNSGAPDPPSTFTAVVNSEPGSIFWVVCLVHHEMRLRVSVVADPASATPQSAIDQTRSAQIAEDTDWARATHARYSARRSSHLTASGKRVWDAWAGVDNRHAALYAFYPKRISIRKGDIIRWRWDALAFEDHTVSMPIPAVFRLDFATPVCDPDGDQGTQPDTPAEENADSPPGCPEGSTLELDLEHGFWGGVGNGVLRGANDVEHSGMRGAQAEGISPPAVSDSTWDVRFPEATGDADVKYLCFLHPGMRGRVRVRA